MATPHLAPMRRLVAGLALAGAAACGGPQVGPCTLLYDDPLFVVAAVTDARSGAPIARVVLRDFSYKGAPVTDLTFLTRNTGAPPRNVSVTGGELLCDIACAFGASQGAYTFTARAAGYRDTTLTLDAKYARGGGDCPTRFSGGMVLRLTMTPP